ncbi:MAG TPA: hypothetical protein VFV50_17210 [Bdellovibrionales bacterium]|nr:hypothetical protein [Bdellovibrionales bacterium]
MKVLFIALALFGSTIANATTLNPHLYTLKTSLQVTEQSPNYPYGMVESAELSINSVLRTVKLKLKFPQICPRPKPGQVACLGMSMEDRVIEVPMLSNGVIGCGSTLYVGQKDQRPVDGNFIRIRVLDHSTSTCALFAPNAMTQVEVIEVTSGMAHPVRQYKLLFLGGKLSNRTDRM